MNISKLTPRDNESGRFLGNGDKIRLRRRVTVSPTPELYERIKQYAEQHRLSMGNALLAMLEAK